jgi:nitrogen-specific signal transduction histidine kinase/CheY-like chemotaxis protein
VVAVVLSITGFVIAVLALCRAFSDHKVMKNKVKVFEHELKRTQKLLSQQGVLAHEIAHELKNPITAILCSVDTLDLLAGDQLEPNQRRSLKAIKDFGENVLQLVSDFLDVSRAEIGLLSARPENIAVRQVVENVQALLQSLAIRANVEVVFETPQREPKVYMDPRHLKQVVFNILHNAIKFSPSGSNVTVRTEILTAGVNIVFTDEGIGMSRETAEHAFDPYYAGGKGLRGASDGLGLGLPLCKSLVGLAGGSLELESVLGQGTIVSLLLIGVEENHTVEPQNAEDLTSPLNHQQAYQPLSGQRVLIFDEDVRVRAAVSELIEAWGGLAVGVSDAAQAVIALESHSYDAVVIDESRGDDLYAENQVKTAIARLCEAGKPVIVSRQANHSLETGAAHNDYPVLSKPYNGSALLSLLLKAGEGQEYSH